MIPYFLKKILAGDRNSLNLLVIIIITSRFGFEGWIWVLIASVPDLCILFTFYVGRFIDNRDCRC